MTKLTTEERERAKRELAHKLEQAIEEAPKGLTDGEIRECVLQACCDAGILSKGGTWTKA